MWFDIPTQAVWFSFGTAPGSEHIRHLSSKAWMESSEQMHLVGFDGEVILSPGQIPRNWFQM